MVIKYVIQNNKGEYQSHKRKGGPEWVKEFEYARVFHNRGCASSSIKPYPNLPFEIIPVKVELLCLDPNQPSEPTTSPSETSSSMSKDKVFTSMSSLLNGIVSGKDLPLNHP